MGQDWAFDVFGEIDGIIAILPFGEVKSEIRKHPKAMYNIMEIAAENAFETSQFNITGGL